MNDSIKEASTARTSGSWRAFEEFQFLVGDTSPRRPAKNRLVTNSTTEEQQTPESSTAELRHPKGLDEQIEMLFKSAEDEIFEDGVESEFSRQLACLVREAGNAAVEVMAYLVVYEKVNAETAAEALRWLGRITHSPSYRYRQWLLERSLRSSSSRVRDAAALGLVSLDDPHAIRYLRIAIEHEKCSELRNDLRQALEQLKSTTT